MDFKLPVTFVQSRSRLTWREVEFGLQNGWLSDDDAIQVAVDRFMSGNQSAEVFELASVLAHETYKVSEIVHRLVEHDPELSKGKWLFLLLAWLYENRDTVEEPLAVVEKLYADFDYPREVAGFVRYMPPQDPSRVGDSYLIENWRRYIDTARSQYGPKPTEH